MTQAQLPAHQRMFNRAIVQTVYGLIPRGLAAAMLATAAEATPIQNVRTETDVDWTSAGVGGIGNGSGTINLTGVSGIVRKAFLYWHGIDPQTGGGDGVYDNESI